MHAAEKLRELLQSYRLSKIGILAHIFLIQASYFGCNARICIIHKAIHMFNEKTDLCKKKKMYWALSQMENCNFHLLNATMMYMQIQLIPVGNYCSNWGSH